MNGPKNNDKATECLVELFGILALNDVLIEEEREVHLCVPFNLPVEPEEAFLTTFIVVFGSVHSLGPSTACLVGPPVFSFAQLSRSNQERKFGHNKPEQKIGCRGQTKRPFTPTSNARGERLQAAILQPSEVGQNTSHTRRFSIT
jgi:hypothetical protein